MRRAPQIAELFLVACLAAAPVRADFVNGDFEDGDFTGWTRNGGRWPAQNNIGQYNEYPDSDPGRWGYSGIVGQGSDRVLALAGISLSRVYQGKFAARINHDDAFDPPYWGYCHYSQISQTVVCPYDKLVFAWCAVLQDPQHARDDQPHFRITLEDADTGEMLLPPILIAAGERPQLFKTAAVPLPDADRGPPQIWKYTGWRLEPVDVPPGPNQQPRNIKLTLLASDCGLEGHSGYVYLDAFMAPTIDKETANALKGGAMNRVSNCLPTPSKWLNGRLCEGIKRIRSSLDTKRWVDGDHLHTKRGAAVFDHEREAAGVLLQIAANPSVDPAIVADVEQSLADLAAADDRLAKTIIDEATGVVTKPKALVILQAARAAYNAAKAAAATGNYPVAISQYQTAWRQAINAISSNR